MVFSLISVGAVVSVAAAVFLDLLGVWSPNRRVIIGLRLRVRACRASGPLSLLSDCAPPLLELLFFPSPVFFSFTFSVSSSSYDSSSTGCGVASRFLADRVIGPLYEDSPSVWLSSRLCRSDGVGLGEMTRGVAGMLRRRVEAMLSKEKGGRTGAAMTPLRNRRKSYSWRNGQHEREESAE